MSKIIEEMAQDVEKVSNEAYKLITAETQAYVKEHHRYNSKEDYLLAHDKPVNERIAEALYNLGYRKIDKDSVVLNSEQYSNYLITQTNNEFLKEQAEKLKADIERLYKNIGKFKDIVSKETAEKILKDIMFCIDINDCNKNEVLILNLCKMLAKQFGVEVEEL